MIKAVPGTKDILPEDINKWYYIEHLVKSVMKNFNYQEIRTPVFEETNLFSRGIGESTDIVSKEMYTFIDKGETSITLKPELTAPVVRAYLEHSLSARQNITKLFYISPAFRQERPQAGRLRQFHQFGGEVLGSPSPSIDAELIIIAYDILKFLALKNLTVKINSLGVPESREKYKIILKEYLQDKIENLSEESRKRFNTNILRIFDSKDERDQKIMAEAPLLIDYLDEESKDHFDMVKELLDLSVVPYEIDPKLVRGLDYYTKTTFEIISSSVGAQSALCGGGRYDLLAEQIGGKPTPGMGFAAGIERILLACENENTLNIPQESIDLYIVRIDENLAEKVFELGLFFRRENIKTEFDYSQRSVKAQMREANKLKARYVIFIGGDEYKEQKFILKNMISSEQEFISLEKIDSVIYIARR